MEYKILVCGSPQRTDKNGLQAVRLYISFAGTKAYLPTGVKWAPSLICQEGLKQGTALSKSYLDAQKKIIALKEKVVAAFSNNEIKNIRELHFCIDNKGGKRCFLLYWERKAAERLKLDLIDYNTYKAQIASLNAIKNITPILSFTSIDRLWLERYKQILTSQGYKRNTIWARLKDFRTYFNLAKKEGYTQNYPFEDFKMPRPQSRIEYLSESEFQSLKLYFEETENHHHREALRPFLFSCYTGLRISDVYDLRRKNFKTENLLLFEPIKGRRSLTKKFIEIEIPVHQYAQSLIDLNIRKEIHIFRNLVSEQKINDHFKTIAKVLKITPFSFHYSRHTFAIRFLAAGGKIEVLQRLLGHEDIKSTLIYTHVEPTQYEKQINLLT